MPELLIDSSGLAAISLELGATPAHCNAALRSTLKRMATWLKALSLRGLPKELDVPLKVLRKRLKTFRLHASSDGTTVTVFYGLDPVALIHMTPKKTADGVQAGQKRHVTGGFIAKAFNGKRQVFKREGAKRIMTKGVNAGKLKQPLVNQKADIKDAAETWIEDKLVGAIAFEKRFFDTFRHELQWRMQTLT